MDAGHFAQNPENLLQRYLNITPEQLQQNRDGAFLSLKGVKGQSVDEQQYSSIKGKILTESSERGKFDKIRADIIIIEEISKQLKDPRYEFTDIKHYISALPPNSPKRLFREKILNKILKMYEKINANVGDNEKVRKDLAKALAAIKNQNQISLAKADKNSEIGQAYSRSKDRRSPGSASPAIDKKMAASRAGSASPAKSPGITRESPSSEGGGRSSESLSPTPKQSRSRSNSAQLSFNPVVITQTKGKAEHCQILANELVNLNSSLEVTNRKKAKLQSEKSPKDAQELQNLQKQIDDLTKQKNELLQKIQAIDPQKAKGDSPSSAHRIFGNPDFGLSPNDAMKLDYTIQAFKSRWLESLKKNPSEHIFLKHSEHLPRSIDIFLEDGNMVIMVLCKKKGGAEIVGQGDQKIIKKAIEWEYGGEFADEIFKDKSSGSYSLSKEEKDQALEEIRIHQKVDKKPGISGAPMGVEERKSKDSKGNQVVKLHYYQLLYPLGNLQNFVIKNNTSLSPAQKGSLILGLLDSAESLSAGHIIHRDVKEDNALVARNLRAERADFGLAMEMKTDNLLTTDQFNKLDKGSPAFKSPEQLAIVKLRDMLMQQVSFSPEGKAIGKRLMEIREPKNRSEIIEKNALEEQKLKLQRDQESKVYLIISEMWARMYPRFETYSVGLEILGILSGQISKEGNKLAPILSGNLSNLLFALDELMTPEVVNNTEKVTITPDFMARLKKWDINLKVKEGDQRYLHELFDEVINNELDKVDLTGRSNSDREAFAVLRNLLRGNFVQRMTIEDAKKYVAERMLKA